jgi:hypothetical protein
MLGIAQSNSPFPSQSLNKYIIILNLFKYILVNNTIINILFNLIIIELKLST